MTITRFAFPTAIHFGAGARKLVAAHLLEQGFSRPLIVTDRALAALPVMAEFKTHLAGLAVGVFDGVHGNPTCAQVMAGAAAYKAHGADCIIGFGGGAALDVAKVVGRDGGARRRRARVRLGPPAGAPDRPPRCRTSWHCPPPAAPVRRSAVRRWSAENDTHVKRTVFSAKLLAKRGVRRPRTDAGPARPP
jgi:hypothetical protein